MQALFDAVNAICAKIQIVSNLFWDFPCNLDWYGSIPILGNFSLAIILLVGTGIYFTFRLHFVQVHNFIFAVKVLMQRNHTRNGISSLTAFLLSTAMRVGPGNILGVTGAISIGGPGALFWMWVSAFFGMATSFAESTLSQIFKEKRDNEYVGGLPFYARKLLNDSAAAGVALSMLYIVYALLCFPAQGFNTISAVGAIASKISGVNIPTNSSLYWIAFAVLIVITAVISVLKGFLHLRKLFNLIFGQYHMPQYSSSLKKTEPRAVSVSICPIGFRVLSSNKRAGFSEKIKSAYSFENSETTVLYALRISVVLDFAP